MARPKLSADILAGLKEPERLQRQPVPDGGIPISEGVKSMDYWLVRWQEPDENRSKTNPFGRLVDKSHLIRCSGDYRQAEAAGMAYVRSQSRLAAFKRVERHEATP